MAEKPVPRLSPVVLAVLASCGSTPASNGSAPTLFPVVVFSGVDDAGGKYKVPIAAADATGIAWSSSSNAVATVTGDDGLATIVSQAVGTAKVSAKVGDQTTSVDVTVTAYAAADKTSGGTVYAAKGCGAMGCHSGDGSPDITPSGIGQHTDAQALGAILTGANPEGGRVPFANHQFPLNADEQRAILPYLRSLEPRGRPKADE